MNDETAARRAAADQEPEKWRAGGSPSTKGRTIYQGNRFVGLLLDAADVQAIVDAMNREER